MKTALKLAALVVAVALPFSAHAHKAWLLPSSTVVTPNEYITVDAAVSNDIFYFNHNPLRIDGLVITAPDGSVVAPENVTTGKFRSSFDLQLTLPGTYRLSNSNHGLSASYKVGEEPNAGAVPRKLSRKKCPPMPRSCRSPKACRAWKPSSPPASRAR
jgi:uncharacterized GH25 family protein